jgi:transposase-like protein
VVRGLEVAAPTKDNQLSEAERRAIALAALSAEKYGSVAELARRFGISRQRVYQIRDDYSDPEKLERLEDEVVFRRRLVELLAEQDAASS